MSFFGKNIKKIRAVKKLSQTAFADLFKIKRASIGAYEEGRAEAKIDKIIEIAKYFKLTLNQLLTKELTLNEIYHINDLKSRSLKSFSKEIPFVKSNNFDNYAKKYKHKKFINSLEKIIIPNSKNCSIAFEYSGIKIENFYFNIKHNDILICEKVRINAIKEDSIIVAISKNNVFIGMFSIVDSKFEIKHDNTIHKLDKLENLYVAKKIICQSLS